MRAASYWHASKDCKTVFGASFRCRSRQFVERRIRYFGIFEHNLTYFTLDRLKPGGVYVDVGANIGYYTLLASISVGAMGRVIAIEADPETFEDLQINLGLNGCANVEAHNIAATEFDCKVRIKRVTRNAGSNSVAVAEDGEVRGVPLRGIIGDNISKVNFIKIDIEGSEEPILRQILEMLGELPDDLVIASEISANSAHHVARFAAAGFRTFAIHNIYSIDYYLIRSYLDRYEDKSVSLKRVAAFEPQYGDYVFIRGQGDGLTALRYGN